MNESSYMKSSALGITRAIGSARVYNVREEDDLIHIEMADEDPDKIMIPECSLVSDLSIKRHKDIVLVMKTSNSARIRHLTLLGHLVLLTRIVEEGGFRSD